MPESVITLLNEYGAFVLFVNVFLVQLGLPVPAVPGLVLAGALAAAGKLDPLSAAAAAVIASMLADLGWYLTGRRLGRTVLLAFARFSLSTDLFVRQVESKFQRWGPSLLLFAKFIPGSAMVTPSLAGITHIPWRIFLFFANMGSLLWAGTFIWVGYALNAQALSIIAAFESYGIYILTTMMVLGSFFLARSIVRRRMSTSVDWTRITAEHAHTLLSEPTETVLIDVRSSAVRDSDGRQLPGACVFDIDELDKCVRSISRQAHLIIFCACSDELSSLDAARRLKQLGYAHVSLLKNGIDGWVRAGFPVIAQVRQA